MAVMTVLFKAALVPCGNIGPRFLNGTFTEGPSNRDDVAPGGLTHTDDCLHGCLVKFEVGKVDLIGLINIEFKVVLLKAIIGATW